MENLYKHIDLQIGLHRLCRHGFEDLMQIIRLGALSEVSSAPVCSYGVSKANYNTVFYCPRTLLLHNVEVFFVNKFKPSLFSKFPSSLFYGGEVSMNKMF